MFSGSSSSPGQTGGLGSGGQRPSLTNHFYATFKARIRSSLATLGMFLVALRHLATETLVSLNLSEYTFTLHSSPVYPRPPGQTVGVDFLPASALNSFFEVLFHRVHNRHQF